MQQPAASTVARQAAAVVVVVPPQSQPVAAQRIRHLVDVTGTKEVKIRAKMEVRHISKAKGEATPIIEEGLVEVNHFNHFK
uniref:Uncharacterized protein n=1 Tax=Romanomermis culicivorax TaxID=13658 RepID=A0A915KLC1_ROMCU